MASGLGGSKVSSGSPPSYTPAKRRLLMIYIHGFMGNETSFQSFPAHLHNLLMVTMEDLQYTVHTKVYPKFKTRHHITVATEDFSTWLSAFENDNTDVVLLGHSMGGILAAEVVLLQDSSGNRRHRILGIISFDSPFLGMHPGVISAGLGSLFRAEPKSPPLPEGGNTVHGGGAASASVNSLSTVDEFFDKRPARNFTVVESKQEGTWGSALKFINKHHSRLTVATGQYLLSHLEFGGCLADPIGLRDRYNAICRLEDPHLPSPRVRFVNYYTSSTGRSSAVPAPAPTALLPEHSFELADSAENMRQSDPDSTNDEPLSMQLRDPDPMSDAESFDTIKTSDTPPAPVPTPDGDSDGGGDDTPPPPPLPERPAEFDYALIPDPSVRRAAEKAAAKALKAWEKGMKEYEKQLEKVRKREAKDAATVESAHQRQEKARLKKEQERMHDEEKRMNAASSHSPPPPPPTQHGEEVKERKESRRPKRERKFCLLPKDKSDKCWVKVEMTGVDEVGAHCGLFFLGEVYERLVGDVAVRLEEWVGEERSRRMVESEFREEG